MTALTETRGFFSAMADMIAADHTRIALGATRFRTYRRTIAELSALTDRELRDIGVARGDIARVARDAARSARSA